MIMDAVTASLPRQPDAMTAATLTADACRSQPFSDTYLLSEESRKASLLAGGNGRAVHVPTNRLHLVSVDANGVAPLKLQPRSHLEDQHGIVRIGAAPTCDAPPDIEALSVATPHRIINSRRRTRASSAPQRPPRWESDVERGAPVAHTFLQDATQRAVVHPAPTPTRCYLAAIQCRPLRRARRRDPPERRAHEAHRRFRADLRVRQDENRHREPSNSPRMDEKARVIAEWIVAHGTPVQAQHAAASSRATKRSAR